MDFLGYIRKNPDAVKRVECSKEQYIPEEIITSLIAYKGLEEIKASVKWSIVHGIVKTLIDENLIRFDEERDGDIKRISAVCYVIDTNKVKKGGKQ